MAVIYPVNFDWKLPSSLGLQRQKLAAPLIVIAVIGVSVSFQRGSKSIQKAESVDQIRRSWTTSSWSILSAVAAIEIRAIAEEDKERRTEGRQ